MKEVENLITVVEIDDVDKHHVFVDFKESGP